MTTHTDCTLADAPDHRLAALFDVAMEPDVRLCALMLETNRLPARGGLAVDGDALGHGWARHKRSY